MDELTPSEVRASETSVEDLERLLKQLPDVSGVTLRLS